MNSSTALTQEACEIVLADAELARSVLPELMALLQDAVDQGASVGFLAPLSDAAAADYWRGAMAEIGRRDRMLWLAYWRHTLVGAVQLGLCHRENGQHRAEVQKLFVHSRARRGGIASCLVQALEHHARATGLRTLHLDTEQGSAAERFYQEQGYTKVGHIPDYCLSAEGRPNGTTIYYKQLARAAQEEPA